MFYEIGVIHNVVNDKGEEKQKLSKFIVDKCELFAEAEAKGLEEFAGNCDVVAIKQSKIREFVNEPEETDEEHIYYATIIDTFVNDDGSEKEVKYQVAVYAESTTQCNKIVNEYMAQGLNDMRCVAIKQTKFECVI